MSNLPTRSLLAAALGISLCSSFALAGEQPLRISAAQSGEPVALASAYLESKFGDYGLIAGDVEHCVSSAVPTRHNGLTHVYLQQSV